MLPRFIFTSLLALAAPFSMLAAEPGKYVALGSSYAAGPGVASAADPSPDLCQRSTQNYAQKLARKKGLQLVDASCTGASIGAITDYGQYQFPPQIDRLEPDDHLVTITIGGNDVFYIASMIAMACRNSPVLPPEMGQANCVSPSADKVDAALANLGAKMTKMLELIRHRAPKAQVILVGYLPVLPTVGTCDKLTLTAEDANHIRGIVARINESMRQAAQRAQVQFLDAMDLGRGHDACSQEPWTTGFRVLPSLDKVEPVPFHPNESGMAAVAEALDKLVRK